MSLNKIKCGEGGGRGSDGEGMLVTVKLPCKFGEVPRGDNWSGGGVGQ